MGFAQTDGVFHSCIQPHGKCIGLVYCTYSLLLSLDTVEDCNALNVACLREEIKAPQTLNLIPPPLALSPDEDANVPCLCVHVAAHVHDTPGPEIAELGQEIGVAALARRVKHDHSLIRVILDVAKQLTRIGGDEAAAVIAEAVELGVAAGVGDGVGGDVDASRVLEDARQGDGEEPRAGIGVDEELDGVRAGGGQDVLADVGGELGEDGVVILEEGAGRVGEGVGVDVLGGGGLGVGDAGFDIDKILRLRLGGTGGQFAVFGNVRAVLAMTVRVLAQEDGCAAFVGGELLVHALPLARHAKIDSLGADGALLNIHDPALALEHKANIGAGLKDGALSVPPGARGAVKVRRQLGAVAVLQGAADGVLDGGDELGGEVGEVLVGLVEDALLELELLGVVEHLELATTAGGEVLAADARVVAQGRGLGDGYVVGDGVLVLEEMAPDLDAGRVAGHDEGDNVDLVGAGTHG